MNARFFRAIRTFSCGLLLASCASRTTPAESSADRSSAAPEVRPLTAPLLVRDVGFDTPESVVYDEREDLYLVSNIVGGALERDDQAFISRVRPDGSVAQLKWIDASEVAVELHAPKGLALHDEVLYVADIDVLRKFDRKSGRPLGVISLPGAGFLHDVTVAGDGSLYVSDSGLGAGLAPNGHDAIYRVHADGAVKPLASSSELGQPSGLWGTEQRTFVVSFGSGELYELDQEGVRSGIERLPKGSLDGIAVFEQRLLVSSWEADAVYARSDGQWSVLLSGVRAPADLAIDTRRRRLLVTRYNENALSIHQL